VTGEMDSLLTDERKQAVMLVQVSELSVRCMGREGSYWMRGCVASIVTCNLETQSHLRSHLSSSFMKAFSFSTKELIRHDSSSPWLFPTPLVESDQD
jgi:hypothetical protein